jgi:hypothetical protein
MIAALQPKRVKKAGDGTHDGVGVVAEAWVEHLGATLSRRVERDHGVALGQGRNHGVERSPPTAATREQQDR